MQAFGNVATDPIRKVSKTTNKAYYEFRLCENKRGGEKNSTTNTNTSTSTSTWYSVRVMRDANPGLERGAFCKVTGTLRADSFLNREGKPATALLIIAFEAVKLKGADELRQTRDANRQEEGKKDAVAA